MIDLPIAVLIDDQSISAAEFFAAALQEYERATLVGTHTTGKGRAQRTYALSDGSAVNLSVEEYFTPKGKSLADTGIAPDIETALTDEQTANFYFLGTDGDPQLQKALANCGSNKAPGRRADRKWSNMESLLTWHRCLIYNIVYCTASARR